MRWIFAAVWLLTVVPSGAQGPVELRDIGAVKVARIELQHLQEKPIPNRELRAAMLTKVGSTFQRRYFRGDLSTIENLYRARGYMEVEIVRRRFVIDDKGRLRISLMIDSGSQWTVASVELRFEDDGQDHGALAEQLHKRVDVKQGGVFRYGEVIADERDLLGWLNREGYAQARVRNRVVFDSRRQRAAVEYTIAPGRRMVFGPVEIAEEGLYTRRSLLERQFTFREGQRYNPQKLRETRNNLSRTGLFRSVTLATPTGSSQDSIQPVVLRLQERKFIHLRSRLFVNNRDPGVSGRVQHINFLGRGNRIGVDASLGQPLQGLKLFLTERNLMGSSVDLTVSAGLTEEWGERRVFADPSDSLQFDLLTTNYSPANELLLGFGRTEAAALLSGAIFEYPSVERLYKADAALRRRWELSGNVVYSSNLSFNFTQSRNRPIAGSRVRFDAGEAEVVAPGPDDEAPPDDGFDDDPFGDDGFPDDPFGSSGRTTQGAFVYDTGRFTVDDVWGRLLTDRSKALNFELDFQRDTRDNQIAPAQGTFLRLAGLYAIELGGQRTRVVDGDIEARHYLRIGEHVVWAQAVRGLITGVLRRENDLPQAYWKELGGEGSVRGVERSSIQATGGGRGGAVLRNELRLTFGDAGLVMFWDRAGVWRRVSHASWGDMIDGFGGGLRYSFGIPARLDLGWSRGTRSPEIYVSIGQAF